MIPRHERERDHRRGAGQAVRRRHGPRRRRPRGRRGHRVRPARAERRRQDHRGAGAGHAARTPTPGGPRCWATTWCSDADAVRRRIGLAGQYAAVDANLTGRENLQMVGVLEPAAAAGDRPARRRAARALRPAARRRPPRCAPTRAACAAASTSPRRWCPSRRCCSWTSPPPGSTSRSRNELWDMIRELVDDGTTVLLTTQYLEEADQLADRIAVVDGGKVIANDTPGQPEGAAGRHGGRAGVRRRGRRRARARTRWHGRSRAELEREGDARCASPRTRARTCWSRCCAGSTPAASSRPRWRCASRAWTTSS